MASMDVEFIAEDSPSEELITALAELAPTNPFCTSASIRRAATLRRASRSFTKRDLAAAGRGEIKAIGDYPRRVSDRELGVRLHLFGPPAHRTRPRSAFGSGKPPEAARPWRRLQAGGDEEPSSGQL